MRKPKVQVYAIVRIDKYFRDIQDQIAVQSILPTLQEAEAETERLNAMRDPKDVVYLLRATRFYPEGRAIDVDQTTTEPDRRDGD